MVVWPVVVSCWLLWCPVWVLFLLFNIIGSSPAWFVSKKKSDFGLLASLVLLLFVSG